MGGRGRGEEGGGGQLVQKWFKKMVQKWFKNGSKMVQKWFKNGSKVVKNSKMGYMEGERGGGGMGVG